MARWRVVIESGAYLCRNPEIVRIELGADAHAARSYGVRAAVYELLPTGAEIEGDHIDAGPHLEPLDDEAREKQRSYWLKHPGATLDPTRHLPLGQDPLLKPTFEQAVLRSLESAAADAAANPVSAASSTDAKIDRLADLIGELVAGMAGATRTPPPRKAA